MPKKRYTNSPRIIVTIGLQFRSFVSINIFSVFNYLGHAANEKTLEIIDVTDVL